MRSKLRPPPLPPIATQPEAIIIGGSAAVSLEKWGGLGGWDLRAKIARAELGPRAAVLGAAVGGGRQLQARAHIRGTKEREEGGGEST